MQFGHTVVSFPPVLSISNPRSTPKAQSTMLSSEFLELFFQSSKKTLSQTVHLLRTQHVLSLSIPLSENNSPLTDNLAQSIYSLSDLVSA